MKLYNKHFSPSSAFLTKVQRSLSNGKERALSKRRKMDCITEKEEMEKQRNKGKILSKNMVTLFLSAAFAKRLIMRQKIVDLDARSAKFLTILKEIVGFRKRKKEMKQNSLRVSQINYFLVWLLNKNPNKIGISIEAVATT